MTLEETSKQKNQQQEIRTGKHSFAPKYSQTKISVLQNKKPVGHEIQYRI